LTRYSPNSSRDSLCRIEEVERQLCHVLTVTRVWINQRGEVEYRTTPSGGQAPSVRVSPR